MSLYKEFYNNSYKQFTPDYIQSENISKINRYMEENSESLKDFITKYFEQFTQSLDSSNASVLELGTGIGSLSYFLDDKFGTFTGIDCSDLAIMNAKAITELKGRQLNFLLGDVLDPEFDLKMKFDFLIDSHLFHCLTKDEDFLKYLTFVKKHMNPDGEFLIETMAFHPKIQTPIGYRFGENYILYKEIGEQEIAIRSVKKSMDIEEILKQNGFEIKYLYYHNELSFQVFDEYPNYSAGFLPKTIRLSAKIK